MIDKMPICVGRPVLPTLTHLSADKRAAIIDIWKQIVSVQMHFNEVEMTIRNLYFTVLAGAMGLIGVVYDKSASIKFHDHHVVFSMAMIVVLAVPFISYLFYFMDRHWYHRLLQGAVDQGTLLEERYKDLLPEISLGLAISKRSKMQLQNRFLRFVFRPIIYHKKFLASGAIHSDGKIELLYRSVIVATSVAGLVFVLLGGVRWDNTSAIEAVFPAPQSTNATGPFADGLHHP